MVSTRDGVLLLAAGVASVTGSIIFLVTSTFDRGPLAAAYGLVTAAVPVAFWAVGSTIVTRGRGHVIGWLMVATAVLAAAIVAGLPVATGDTTSAGSPLEPWAVLLVVVAYGPTFVVLILAAMVLFPDGRLPGPAWRVPTLVPVLMVSVSTTARLLRPGPMGDGLPVNPMGVAALPADVLTSLFVLGPLGIATLGLVGATGLVARFVRGAPEARAQLKWLLASVLPAVAVTPFSFFDADQTAYSLADVLSAATLLLVPLTIGIAVLRYRLYEIDRIVSRTIGWAIVTGVLVTVFAAVVVALQAVLASMTDENTLAVAASTLVAFALFQPVRRRVQRAVDRRFDRSRYDGERVVAAFAARLRDQVDLRTLEVEVARVAIETVRPTSTAVWLR